MNKSSKLANLLSSVGVLGGIVYGMKKNKSFGATALYVIGFGVAGIFIGNSLSKLYE
jgi:hypothetical protein